MNPEKNSEDNVGAVDTPIKVKRLDQDLPIPTRSHPEDAGLDLYCSEDVRLEPFERRLVPTGIALALPVGAVGLIHPRSGLAHRHGLSMVNAPGTIDAGYRGEIFVNLINLDPKEAVVLERGSRVAQLVIQRVELANLVEVDELDDTIRGDKGHGSTGIEAR